MREVWSHITVPSFQSDYMMSNQSAQTFTDPAFQNKMPLFDGSVTSPGLPKPQNMSGFFSKQPIQYSGAYFAYDPRGADTTAFSPPWSSCKSSLLDCRSPVNSLSGLKGRNHIIYRQDNMLSSEKSHSPSVHHIPLKQGFTCYTRSPGISRPTSPTSVTVKQKNGGGTSPSENSVYLAIPKPIYGQNPYCNELGCVVGQQYSVGHGSQRIPNPAYEREWVLTDSHCSERLSTERNTHNLLLQQRGLKVQPTAEPFKRETVETYSSLSPGRRMSLPAVMEPNYNSYPCTQVRTLLGPLSEQSQHLQSSPRGYHSLYSSHPTHERMTSEVFQECSVSKYGQLTKHPMFYYPQTNVELENSRRTKDSHGKQRDDVPVILQHAVSSPRDHYVIPQSIHDEIPLPSAQSLPNHSFVQHFDYPCYAVPRVHLNGSPVRVPVKRQHAPLSGINISPTSQCMDHLLVSSANLHNDKPNTSLHTSPPFLHVDQPSSSRHIGQPEFSPVGIQIGKLLSPTTSMHIDQLHSSPVSLNIDRHLDYSPCNGQLAYLKTPRGFVISPGAQLPQSPNRNSAQDQTPLASGSNLQKKMYSPTVAKGSEHNGSATVNPTGTLRKHLLDSSPCSNIKEETKDLCQVGPIKKRPKMEKEENKNDSPPMPVIDVVFSLAPYKSYLQKARALSPAKESQRTVHSPEVHEVETKSYIKEKSPASEEQLPVVCAQTLAEKSDEALEPKCIKLEKGDPDGNKSARKIKEEDYNETSVKMEKQEDGSPNNITLFVINKCKPEELECQPPCAGENNTSDHSAQREVTKDMETFSEGNTCTERTRVAVPDPKSILPPEPPQNKINFKNIPLQCLKLSTYKMILPDTKQSSKPVSVIEKSLGMPASANTPHLEHQMPVRKHFFELHHSLCKLVSRSVSVSSQEDLRTWLFHLELVETPSHNVQKLSCLLGVKAREVWLNEEIKSALHEVVERLMEYISVEYCPFPHVIRSGAVFIPMLVLKELLFPSVQGSFIDKVLQEHKVVLRPTTLSEEKLLIQLHKRSCSSKLRRLMSLKYLPNVYMDVVNLYYHACVCRHLESTSPDVQKRIQA
ncbi:uncharacterized protein C15orf39 homolog [Thalassophryne amazonica]|uniref:uncharacterized protein C15orf39 homolog n=1 Tax=Thalassophryne amazonica TaxID=390379 RepID=UPI001471AA8C|nr:uncharacterized protein C15orf39 homolog [Thalassophryne amazonica]